MEKSTKVLIITAIILVGFTFGVFYHYIMGFYLHYDFPLNTFLGNPQMAFTDFTGYITVIKDFAPYIHVNSWINYFPLAYILFFPFSLINNNIISYSIFLTIFISFLIYTNIKFVTCENNSFLQNFFNVFIITFLSYPILLTIDKGNLDAILLIFFTVFVFLFKKEKYFLSALFLAFINAIKPFMILFVFLFLFKKKYKALFFNIVITSILIFGGFMVLKGNFFTQVSNFILNLTFIKQDYVYLNMPKYNFGMIQNSSLFMALKLILCRLTIPPILGTTLLLEKFYNFMSTSLIIIILFFSAKENIFWKKIALLTFSMLVFPYIVNDYKLIFALVPMWLFFNEKTASRFDLTYSILFGFLFIPKNLAIMNYPVTPSCFSISIILNPLILLIFITLLIIDFFISRKKEV